MKKTFAVIALVLLTACSAFALSDAEYLRMKRNSVAFSRADRKLSQVWGQLRKSLPKHVFYQLQEYQREWIASGRDIEAQGFIDEGYSRIEAYTMATNDRAEALPRLAEDLKKNDSPSRPRATTPPAERPSRPAARPSTRTPEPEPEPEPEPTPASRPSTRTPEPEPEPEPEPTATDEAVDPEGEYEGTNCFFTVKIVDRSSMEAEVVVSRWKDEVNWKASGWIDDNVLELSDANYSMCQATIVFSANGARISLTDSGDWAKATADDFEMAGTYRKKQ